MRRLCGRGGEGRTAAAVSPARQEGLEGRDGGGSSCPDDGRMDHGCLNLSFAFLLLIFLLLGYCPYLSGTTISLLVRTNTTFFFWMGLMESRFN